MRRRYIREAALTDVGRVRDHNEDSLGVSQADNLYIVADGMGGHAAGEVASRLAVDELVRFFREEGDAARGAPRHLLARGIERANARIHEAGAANVARRGMGTTIVAMHINERVAHIAHVGDSRVYRLRGGELTQVTQDHSWFAELKANAHELDAETLAYAERYKNVITRALGMHGDVQVDVCDEPLEDDDLYLLCSDGLHDMIDDEQIAAILRAHMHDLELGCERLVEAANASGGNDNVTVMLVHVVSLAEREEAIRLADEETVAAEEQEE